MLLKKNFVIHLCCLKNIVLEKITISRNAILSFRVYFHNTRWNLFLLAWSILLFWVRCRYVNHIINLCHRFLLALIYICCISFFKTWFKCLLITHFGCFIKYILLIFFINGSFFLHCFSKFIILEIYFFTGVLMFTICIFSFNHFLFSKSKSIKYRTNFSCKYEFD